MFIYLLTNIVTGKYYVGQTTKTTAKRWAEHIRHARLSAGRKQNYLYKSLTKYGGENFKTETLSECPDQQCLDASEKFFIWFLASNRKSFGYNSDGGGKGGKKTKEVSDKISKTLMGHEVAQETRDKIRRSLRGIKQPPMTEETKEKIRIKNKIRSTPEQMLKCIESNKGRKHSTEWNNKIKEAHIKRWKDKRNEI